MMIVYDTKGDYPGRITEISSGPDPETHGKVLEQWGMTWIVDPQATTEMIFTHYVVGEKLVERPIFQLIEDGNRIHGIPIGTQVTVSYNGVCVESGIVSDGEVEFLPDHPGSYRLTFALWPYLSLHMDVTR